MMTTARKSFMLSLMFHSLMGSLAFFVLVKMHTPPPMLKIETKHIMVLSLADSAPKPKHQEVRDIPAEATPPAPPKPQPITQQPITPQPIIPRKAQLPQPTPQTQAVTTSPTPVVSTPPVVQRVQNAPAAEIVQAPSKPKVDIASEKRSFYALLRNAIQKNLRYPYAARRAGKEGEIGVRFTLSDDGTIKGISVQRGEDIFHNAAKLAVVSASGVKVPDVLTDSLPAEIDLTLEFKLN